MIGQKLGSYEIIEEIGKGGMATVYRAYQPSIERDVAIKVIGRSIAGNERRSSVFNVKPVSLLVWNIFTSCRYMTSMAPMNPHILLCVILRAAR